ncbi:MAG: hypothetical protein HY722_00520 [Planctomycetes bacterium]|nr:hypothetical protein [Planctomycetota bacterium]
MEILINGNPELVSADPGTPVVRIVEQLRRWLRDQGLVVSQAELDGGAVDLERLDGLGGSLVDAYRRLTITAAAPERLALEVIRGLVEMLARLADNMRQAARMVQEGRVAQGLERFRGGIEGWSVLQDSLARVGRLLGLDLGGFQGPSGPLGARMAHLGGILARTQEAIQHADAVAMGDLLEYELVPLAEEWSKTLGFLHDHVVSCIAPDEPPAPAHGVAVKQ